VVRALTQLRRAGQTRPVTEWIYFIHPPRDDFAATMTAEEETVWAEWESRGGRTCRTGRGTFSRPEAFGPVGDPAVVRQRLAERLEHEVPLPDLSAQGWTLRDVAVVQVQALPAARCVFARGGSTLTLLSLPSAAFAGAEDGDTYQTVVDGHPLAGFIRGGGVHCVVGDANTPLGDITPITDHLRRS